MRARGATLLESAWELPNTTVDPFGPIQQLAAQGNPDLALKVATAAASNPGPWKLRFEQALGEAEGTVSSIRRIETELASGSARLSGAFDEMRAQAENELASIKTLGVEVGQIAHDKAADFLKKGYESEAARVQKRADIATAASIALATVLAVATAVIARNLPKDGTLSAALEKGALTIPFVALNVYLARLASHLRDEALRWRHIKLQIQTVSPFLGTLDEKQRKETLALLATRFFPGQPMPMPAHAAAPSDLSAALASMVQPEIKLPKVTVDASGGTAQNS